MTRKYFERLSQVTTLNQPFHAYALSQEALRHFGRQEAEEDQGADEKQENPQQGMGSVKVEKKVWEEEGGDSKTEKEARHLSTRKL